MFSGLFLATPSHVTLPRYDAQGSRILSIPGVEHRGLYVESNHGSGGQALNEQQKALIVNLGNDAFAFVFLIVKYFEYSAR